MTTNDTDTLSDLGYQIDTIAFLVDWFRVEPGIVPQLFSGSEEAAAAWTAWTLVPVLP